MYNMLTSLFPKKNFRALRCIVMTVMALCVSMLPPLARTSGAETGGGRCASPPVSHITAPLNNAVIGNTASYTVTGTASSSASRVVKVKVSTNGGKTWRLASDTSTDHSWSTWSFTWRISTRVDDDADAWEERKDGSYVIMSRAKGEEDCVETSSGGVTVTIDNTAPTTTASAVGYIFGSWSAASPVSVTLSASDGAGSGIAAGYPKYCLDAANTCTPNLSYAAPVQVACTGGSSCTQYVRYQSVDKAGNSENVKSSVVKQNPPDLQAPATTASASGYTFGAWTATSPVTVTMTASDGAGSGVAPGFPKYCVDAANTCLPSVTYGQPVSLTCAAGSACTQFIRYRSVDNAGNTEPVQSAVVNQDLQAPVVSANPAGGNVGASGVTLTCADNAGSGCNKIYFTLDGSTPTANSAVYSGPILLSKTTTMSFFAADNAGNSGAVHSAVYTVTNVITANAGPNGAVSCTPAIVDYNANSLCTITAQPGYHVASVMVGPTGGTLSPVGAVASYALNNVTTAMTITAAFAIDTFAVTPTAGTGGRISPETVQTVNYGGSSTFAATPDTGYHVAAITGCNGTLAGTSFTTGAIASNCTVTATFAADTFTITAVTGANGRISCNPATVAYQKGSVCTITPDSGYHASVTGCNGTLSGDTYLIAAVVSDCSVFGTFAEGAPTAPAVSFPPSSGETSTVTPVLSINAATDPDGDVITYTYEVYADGGLTSLVSSGSTTSTSWTVPVPLADNTLYFWRAQASDGTLNSSWMPTANFFVNTVNDPPTGPTISSPMNNANVASLTPALSVANAADVDMHDVLSYDFDVATDGGFTNIVASGANIAQGNGGTTSWTVAPALADHTPYYWRARATDNNGGVGPWTIGSLFVDTVNLPPTAPTLNAPADTGEVATFTPTLSINNASDPDRQTLMYTFEIDTVNTFDSPGKQTSGAVAEGSAVTGWTPAALSEDTVYYWRAKANDGLGDGPWMKTASLFVNTVNEPPSVPTLNNPAAGGWVTVLAPTLQLNASTDPDRDSLTYEYEIFSDSGISTMVTSTSGAGSSWVVPMNLTDNTWYWWRAQARDEHGLASGWMTAGSFFVNDKGYNDPPSIVITKPAAVEPATNAMSYTVAWTAADPDSDPVITLYYDTTGTGFNGTQIATGMHLSDPLSNYVWDISGLANGTYYVYAKIDDGTTAVFAYAAGPLVINRTPPLIITAAAEATGSITPSGTITVNKGSNLTFTITPNAGYTVRSLLVDGANKGTGTTYTFTNITASHTINAYFKLITYTIQATAGAGGSISPAGTTTLNMGAGQTYTITPAAGYHIADLLVDGASVGAAPSYVFSNVTANHTISAVFGTNTPYIVTAATGPNGAISPSGAVTVFGGANQKFTMTADAGYRVADVLVDGSSAGPVTSYSFANVQAAHTISASFTPDVYTVTSTADVNGSIAPSGTLVLSKGASQTYTITPDPGFDVRSVLVDGANAGAVTMYTFTNVAANHTISAYFKVKTFTITVSAGAGGAVSPTTTTVNIGASQTFTIIPTAGYHVADVLVDGTSVGPATSYTFSNVAADHVLAAVFAANQSYTISAAAGANGSISPSGDTSVLGGTNLMFTISPAAGYRVLDVKVDGISAGAVTAYTFANIAGNHTISATFTQILTYAITASAGPNGSLSPSGTTPVTELTNLTYTVTPAAGYRVLDVQVDGVSTGARSSYTFYSVQANHSISATFTLDVYTITAAADANGIISPAGTVTLSSGATQTFAITPNAGYAVQSVLVDGANKGAVTTFSFTNIAANHTITAYFKTITYALTATSGANGTVTPLGTTTVNVGGSQTYAIVPSAGYHIADVLVDGASVGAVASYVFSSVADNHTLAATFAPNPAYTISAPDDLQLAGMHGSISPAGDVSVLGGANQKFTLTPDPGYRVADVQVDGVSMGAVSSYTFSNVQSAHTISVTFTPDVYTITAAADANGSITPSGAITVNTGDSVTFTITPDPGYGVLSVLVDGVQKGSITTFTFDNVTTNHSINAYFR
ncbi:MAG TPA: chitobiase/beta-hexosaminidase C-terminal domain-containing protein [Nitrospirota bacterium]|nr:chitobiase/beta-hexosaminidase C-terminal domain-containing protein [Nitrospirota bacterium]